MSWSIRRQFTIITVLIVAIAVPIIYFGFIFLYKPATCFDGKQNGGENGVDCGGACSLICKKEAFDPLVLWQRAFEVVDGEYNLIAYVENVNTDAGSKDTKYTFNMYDKDNNLVSSKKGFVSIPPRSIIPITEDNIVFDGDIKRISFELEDLIWKKEATSDPLIVVTNEKLTNEDKEPRIDALLQNVIFKSIDNIKVVAIVYDIDNNAIGTSSTFINSISKDSAKNVTFTWPKPFSSDPVRFEIVPLYEIPR